MSAQCGASATHIYIRQIIQSTTHIHKLKVCLNKDFVIRNPLPAMGIELKPLDSCLVVKALPTLHGFGSLQSITSCILVARTSVFLAGKLKTTTLVAILQRPRVA